MLKGVRNCRPKPARCAGPPTESVYIIDRIYLFHIFRFGGYANILRITHLLRDIGIIRGCRHTCRWIPESRAFIIRNANIIVLIIHDDRIARCVILDKCVADLV